MWICAYRAKRKCRDVNHEDAMLENGMGCGYTSDVCYDMRCEDESLARGGSKVKCMVE